MWTRQQHAQWQASMSKVSRRQPVHTQCRSAVCGVRLRARAGRMWRVWLCWGPVCLWCCGGPTVSWSTRPLQADCRSDTLWRGWGTPVTWQPAQHTDSWSSVTGTLARCTWWTLSRVKSWHWLLPGNCGFTTPQLFSRFLPNLSQSV